MFRNRYSLAEVYYAQGRRGEAEPLFMRALVIWEKALGPDDPNVATSLNNLATLYGLQGRYDEAEQLFKRETPASLALVTARSATWPAIEFRTSRLLASKKSILV